MTDLAELRTEGKHAVDRGMRLGHYALEAAAEIERLRAFALSFGRCTCEPGMCDTKTDFQCRAREALDGATNEQKVSADD